MSSDPVITSVYIHPQALQELVAAHGDHIEADEIATVIGIENVGVLWVGIGNKGGTYWHGANAGARSITPGNFTWEFPARNLLKIRRHPNACLLQEVLGEISAYLLDPNTSLCSWETTRTGPTSTASDPFRTYQWTLAACQNGLALSTTAMQRLRLHLSCMPERVHVVMLRWGSHGVLSVVGLEKSWENPETPGEGPIVLTQHELTLVLDNNLLDVPKLPAAAFVNSPSNTLKFSRLELEKAIKFIPKNHALRIYPQKDHPHGVAFSSPDRGVVLMPHRLCPEEWPDAAGVIIKSAVKS